LKAGVITPHDFALELGNYFGRSVNSTRVQIMSDQGVILVAEDNEVDVLLLRRAFAKAQLLNPLQVVHNGEEAIAYLSGKGKYTNRAEYPLPDLVLLDLKMPHKNGLEVLEWIREQPSLSGLRVVMLTSSDQARDVNAAYQLGANSFLVKPVDFEHGAISTLCCRI
jgi:CheY-like chemotaxis protein